MAGVPDSFIPQLTPAAKNPFGEAMVLFVILLSPLVITALHVIPAKAGIHSSG
jgi:hypothetical protein